MNSYSLTLFLLAAAASIVGLGVPEASGGKGVLNPSPETFSAREDLARRGSELLCYPVKAITSRKILPATPPPEKVQEILQLRACPGEYEPGSFVVVPLKADTTIEVSASDLAGKGIHIPARAVDIRSVKRWYQSGLNNIVNEGKRFFVPELLLYDDTLIRVDHEGQHNHVRLQFEDGRFEWRSVSDSDAPFEQTEPDAWSVRTCPIRDAKTLQPVPISRHHAKQFWVTDHVPEDAKPGPYQGEISIKVRGGRGEVIPLRLEVLPTRGESHRVEPLLQMGRST